MSLWKIKGSMKPNLAKLLTLLAPIGIAYAFLLLFSCSYKSETTEPPLTEPVPIAQAEAPLTPEEKEGPFDETLTIQEGDTLASVLGRIGIPTYQSHEIISALSKVFN